MPKMHISQNTRKNMHKINSAKFLESVCNRSILKIRINCDLLVFPLILAEILAKYPLIQLSLRLKFRNLKFLKTCYSQK